MVKKLFLAGWLIIILIMTAVAPSRAQASALPRWIIGGSFTLEDGETLEEDLIIWGGNVTLEKGSIVRGDIQLLGGRIEVYGEVEGNILAAGGNLKLGDDAWVKGDVTLAGTVMERSSSAQIEGEVINESQSPFNHTRFDGLWTPVRWWINSVWNVVWFIGLAFALAALAVLLLMFFEKQTESTARAIVAQPVVSGGLGCLTGVVAPFILVLLALTICLLPVAFVALLLLGVATAFGWIALGYEVGKRLAVQLRKTWAAPFAAGIGTFGLVLVGGLLGIVPFFGWIYTAIISAFGIGAVLLTRFGTQDYVAQITTPRRPAPVPADISTPAAASSNAASTAESPASPDRMDTSGPL